MTYQELYDAFCLAAYDLIDYAKKYPSNKEIVKSKIQYFMNELDNQEAA